MRELHSATHGRATYLSLGTRLDILLSLLREIRRGAADLAGLAPHRDCGVVTADGASAMSGMVWGPARPSPASAPLQPVQRGTGADPGRALGQADLGSLGILPIYISQNSRLPGLYLSFTNQGSRGRGMPLCPRRHTSRPLGSLNRSGWGLVLVRGAVRGRRCGRRSHLPLLAPVPELRPRCKGGKNVPSCAPIRGLSRRSPILFQGHQPRVKDGARARGGHCADSGCRSVQLQQRLSRQPGS
jgi:hypothetical protein